MDGFRCCNLVQVVSKPETRTPREEQCLCTQAATRRGIVRRGSCAQGSPVLRLYDGALKGADSMP